MKRESLRTENVRGCRRIVVACKRPLCVKAAEELKDFLRRTFKLDLPVATLGRAGDGGGRGGRENGGGRFLIGTIQDLGTMRKLSRKAGRHSPALGKMSPSRDAYHLRRVGDDVVITGANDRSALYGIFQLEDLLRTNGVGAGLDVFEEAYFKERWMSPTMHGRSDDEAAFDYLARLGVNVSYLRGRYDALNGTAASRQSLRTYAAARKHLPAAAHCFPPDKNVVKMSTGAYRAARSYGMEVVAFTDEPKMLSPGRAPDAELLAGLPADMLGTPNRGDYRSEGRLAFSVFHPRVERHYRELLRNFLARFPDLKYLYVYNQDVGADNCFPPTDPRGRKLYPKGYTGYPYLAHTRLVEILQDEGRKHRTDFTVVTGTWHWFYEARASAEMVAHLPKGAALACLNTNDDRAAVVVPRKEIKRVLSHVRSRRDLTLIADDDFNGTSDDLLTTLTAGFPLPFRTYKKMHRWAREGAVGITQHHTGGPSLGVNGLNDLAWRYFSWHPLVSEKEARRKIRELTQAQLSDARAVTMMLKAYRYIDKALDVDEQTPRPYLARLTHGSENVFVPLTLKDAAATTRTALENRVYDSRRWHAGLSKEISLLEKALAWAEKATAAAPADKQPFHRPFKKTKRGTTCKEYARVQKEAVELVLRVKISMLHFVQAARAGDHKTLKRIIAAEIKNTKQLLAAAESARRRDREGHYRFFTAALRKKLEAMQQGR